MAGTSPSADASAGRRWPGQPTGTASTWITVSPGQSADLRIVQRAGSLGGPVGLGVVLLGLAVGDREAGGDLVVVEEAQDLVEGRLDTRRHDRAGRALAPRRGRPSSPAGRSRPRGRRRVGRPTARWRRPAGGQVGAPLNACPRPRALAGASRSSALVGPHASHDHRPATSSAGSRDQAPHVTSVRSRLRLLSFSLVSAITCFGVGDDDQDDGVLAVPVDPPGVFSVARAARGQTLPPSCDATRCPLSLTGRSDLRISVVLPGVLDRQRRRRTCRCTLRAPAPTLEVGLEVVSPRRRRSVGAKQRLAAALPGDGGVGVAVVVRPGRSRRRRCSRRRSRPATRPWLSMVDVDEVEQVAVVAAGGAAGADRAALHRVGRRGVRGHPGLAAVVGGR